MMRVCLGCSVLIPRGNRCVGCQRVEYRRRNAHPGRVIYDHAWRLHSESRRAESGACARCGSTDDLTVDHPTDAVLCRSCHLRLEGSRKRVHNRAGGVHEVATPGGSQRVGPSPRDRFSNS